MEELDEWWGVSTFNKRGGAKWGEKCHIQHIAFFFPFVLIMRGLY